MFRNKKTFIVAELQVATLEQIVKNIEESTLVKSKEEVNMHPSDNFRRKRREKEIHHRRNKLKLM